MMMAQVEIVKDVLINVLLVKMILKTVQLVPLWTRVEDPLLYALVNLDILIIMDLVINVLWVV